MQQDSPEIHILFPEPVPSDPFAAVCFFEEHSVHFYQRSVVQTRKNQKCERHYNKERNDSRSVLHQFMT